MPLYHLINLKVKKTTYEFGLWEFILDAVKVGRLNRRTLIRLNLKFST